jgi:hypothetical protein
LPLRVRRVAFERVIGSHRDRDFLALIDINYRQSLTFIEKTPELHHAVNPAVGARELIFGGTDADLCLSASDRRTLDMHVPSDIQFLS